MGERVYIVKHVEDEGPGLLSDHFGDVGRETALIELYRGDPFPEDLDSAAGIVVLGGPMNVYEEEKYPFLKAEDTFIRMVLRKEIPFLGICLGAQLLAKACNAGVVKAPKAEVGWHEVRLTRDGRRDALFTGLPTTVTVFQWHEDAFVIPEGGVLLAMSELCRNQAFRVGSSAYGLQFHGEVTPTMVRGWMEKAADGLPGIDVKQINLESERLRDAYRSRGVTLATNFLRVIESAQRVRRVVDLFVETPRKRSVELWWSLEKKMLL
jgi:GMP synthase (glutamine-hydrolysing)